MPSSLGRRIKEARGEMPRERLAVSIGKSTSALKRWEDDVNVPSDGDLELLAKVTGHSFDWLRTGEGQRRTTESNGNLTHPSVVEHNRKRLEALRLRGQQIDTKGEPTVYAMLASLQDLIEACVPDGELTEVQEAKRDNVVGLMIRIGDELMTAQRRALEALEKK